jgi:hypothetical protein
MRNRTLINAAIGLLILGALLVPTVRADEWDKKTIVSFSEPVQVPGTVLPAGTYVFKLANNQSDRYIVEIFDAHETQLITTIMAIPDYRMQTPDETIISFNERPSGQPEALKAWFYPGDNYGVEFVYPKQRATELAEANNRPVLSIPDDATDKDAMKAAEVAAVPPPVALVAAETPAPPFPAMPEESLALPQTASALPCIALLGVLSLAAALGIRRFSVGTR